MSLEGMDTILFGKEEDTLKWFEDFLKQANGSFQTSVFLFRKYYQKCVEDLAHLQFDSKKRVEYAALGEDKEASLDYECNYINQQDIDQCKSSHYHTNIVEVLRNNPSFGETAVEMGFLDSEVLTRLQSLSDDRVRHLTTEELYLLLTDSNYIELSDSEKEERVSKVQLSKEEENMTIFPFLKLHRLNNLQIKYAHTARVVYLTNYELESIPNCPSLVKNIALTGALFHDVGRFYQGAFYNNYLDKEMGIIDGNKGHAEAGYYYSLLDMISLNTLGVNNSEDLIIHAIASLVVSRHQKANKDNVLFDESQPDLSFGEDLSGKLCSFVLNAYLDAKPFEGGVHARFGSSIPHQQKYMSEAMDAILKMTRNVLEQYLSDPKELDAVLENTKEFLAGSMSSVFYLTKEEEKILEEASLPDGISILKREGQIIRTPELNDWLNQQKRRLFCENNHLNYQQFDSFLMRAQTDLAKFAQFDIVDSIERAFQGDKKLDDEVRRVIDFCLNVVMDADKLDILIQRANKRWVNWNPKRMRIYSDSLKGESFLDVIENVYQIPLSRDSNGNVVLDDRLMRIIRENMQSNPVFAEHVKKRIDFSKEVSEDQVQALMEFLKGNYYQQMITDQFERDSNGKPIFTKDLIEIVLTAIKNKPALRDELKSYSFPIYRSMVGQVIPDEIFRVLQKHQVQLQKLDNHTITISYEELREAHPDEFKRCQLERDLLLPEDLRDKVFVMEEERKGDFRPGDHSSVDPHFYWNNIFPAIWWHIDQFILTNMRSGKSFQFLEDSKLLDRLKEAYQSPECPEEFSSLIDEVIEYGKLFIEVINHTSMKDGELQFDQEGEVIDLLDKDLMIQVRDEACRRWREKQKKKDLDEMVTGEVTSLTEAERVL